jgi:hypothetical protein
MVSSNAPRAGRRFLSRTLCRVHTRPGGLTDFILSQCNLRRAADAC